MTPTKAGYKFIGLVSGSPIFDVPKNGWAQIETRWRLGGGCYSRTLFRYVKGSYAEVRKEIHDFNKNTVEVTTK